MARSTLAVDIAPRPWMRSWPGPLVPRRVTATGTGIWIAYHDGEGRTLRGVLDLSESSSQGRLVLARVRSDFGPARTNLLCSAIARHASHNLAEVIADMQHVAQLLDRLDGAPSTFPAHEVVRAAAALVDALRGGRTTGHLIGQYGEQLRARFEEPAVWVVPTLVASFMAGDLERALSLWEEWGSAIEASTDIACGLLSTVLAALLGRGMRARSLLRSTEARVLTSDHHRCIARLAAQLDLADVAHVHFQTGARQDDPRDWLALARSALDCGRTQEAGELARAWLARNARTDADRDSGLDLLIRAGAVAEAKAVLASWQGVAPRYRALLAELHLWELDLTTAERIAGEVLEREPNQFEAMRVTAAVAVLKAEYNRALALLHECLEVRPRDRPSTLWCAHAQLRMGRIADARRTLERFNKKVTGEHPVAKLLVALTRSSKDATSFIHRDIIRQVKGRRFEFESMSDAEETRLMWETLGEFGGNYSDLPTVLPHVARARGSADAIRSPRPQVVEIQHRVLYEPVDDVIASLGHYQRHHPDVPYGLTYRAELLLWKGEYHEALDIFDALWKTHRPRWGYVGSGAALALLGRYDEALNRWQEGLDFFGSFIAGEATLALRGEVYRCIGETALARADLETAMKNRPSRLGAWINWVLLSHSEGQTEDFGHGLACIDAGWPVLLWEAHRDAGLQPRTTLSPEHAPRVLHQCLRMMRGNRSSYLQSYFVDGEMRVILAGSQQVDRWVRALHYTTRSAEHALARALVEDLVPAGMEG